MPRSWKGLPLPDSSLRLKAPTFRQFTEQSAQGDKFKVPRKTAPEVMVAKTIIDAIDDEGLRLPQGAKYEVWRYAQGLAVLLPSGWTVYVELESQKRAPGTSEGTLEEFMGEDDEEDA